MSDLEWRRRDGVGGWTAENGGSSAYNGCRYSTLLTDSVVANGDKTVQLNRAFGYDTGGYSEIDGDGYVADGWLHAPQDGYYRLTASVQYAADAFDSTHTACIIISPDRDGDWDTNDHLTLDSDPAAAGGVTVTHWLQAGDRVGFSASADGSTRAHIQFSVEIEFVGTGTNPAL